jgi:hypothetical protein
MTTPAPSVNSPISPSKAEQDVTERPASSRSDAVVAPSLRVGASSKIRWSRAASPRGIMIV